MLLDQINSPADLEHLSIDELYQLAEEIRSYILSVLSKSAGHFASNLGIVELTIALHKAFDTPRDKIIWDVGHQSYPHKILTGRRDEFPTIRKYGGLSGFPKPDESEYDVFVAGHASTSLAAGFGIAKARDLNNESHQVVAVIGDGGMTGGMAFEALNAIGGSNTDMIVVLNNNRMSISPTVGALSKYLNKIVTKRSYNILRKNARELINLVSPEATKAAKKLVGLLKGGTVFEELGYRYFGLIDGYDIESLLETFEAAKSLKRPVLIHVITKKGKGYIQAERNPAEYHSVSGGLELSTEESDIPTYSKVFSSTLNKLAQNDKSIVGITAAMPKGTGLIDFKEAFPNRFFDVGLAEQCAVTFAAGLAKEGMTPVAAIYSTFLQRAYDQITHDVCLQNLPVVFGIDRAGLVGADGPTHHGTFDLAYLRHLPNIVVMAPKDENELQNMVKTAIEYKDGPIAVRYPRGIGVGVKLQEEMKSIPIGKGEILCEGDDVLILAIGNKVHPALDAASLLAESSISASVVNARFVKPLDEDLILPLARRIKKIITVEDHTVIGGFGSAVLELLADNKIGDVELKRLGIPDEFIEHGPPETLHKICGYDTDSIVQEALKLVENSEIRN